VGFCRQIRGKVGKHTFLDENYALNTKLLFTKFGSAISTFKSAIYINQGRGRTLCDAWHFFCVWIIQQKVTSHPVKKRAERQNKI